MMSLGTFVVVAIVLGLLEWWRRAIHGRAPRWVNVLALLLEIEIVVGVALSTYRLYQAREALGSAAAADKAAMLANSISSGMNSNAVALAGVVLAVLVLGIGSILARRRPSNAPPSATVRS
jgi:hypothetical protein